MENENAIAVIDTHARVNITWHGENGDLPEAVLADATDAEIRRWVTEAVRSGTVPGITADGGADFTNFVIDRFAPTDARPHRLIQVRPKTEYGL